MDDSNPWSGSYSHPPLGGAKIGLVPSSSLCSSVLHLLKLVTFPLCASLSLNAPNIYGEALFYIVCLCSISSNKSPFGSETLCILMLHLVSLAHLRQAHLQVAVACRCKFSPFSCFSSEINSSMLRVEHQLGKSCKFVSVCSLGRQAGKGGGLYF